MAKKSKSSSSSSASPSLLELPEEVLDQVLLRLPAESVITLRSVCKQFKTYKYSKHLCRSHLQRWVNRDVKTKNVFLRHDFAPDDDDPVSRGKKLCLAFAKSAMNFKKPHNCRFLFEENSSKLQFGGCYDGILCFYELRHLSDDTEKSQDLVIYICNPALNECKVISRRHELIFRQKKMTKVCFVPASDDYRVIVVSVCEYGTGKNVYVFSLNDCRWRQIDTTRAGTVPKIWSIELSQMSDLVVHNQSVYWLSNYYVSNNEADYNVLDVLELNRESVGEIALPTFLRNETIEYGYSCFSLLRHRGSLAICWELPSYYALSYELEMSVMKEKNGVIRWGKPVEIDLIQRLGEKYWFVCRYSRNNWVYLMSSEKETRYTMTMISSIDSAEESLGKFRIPSQPCYGCIAFDYVPSLVTVMPEDHTYANEGRDWL